MRTTLAKTTALSLALAASPIALAETCATSALHTACIDDSGTLLTKSEYDQWYLGHDIADNEFHAAEHVPTGGLQVEVDHQATIVRHEDGYIYALGGKFSVRKSHPLILPIYHTDDIAIHRSDVYMVKDNKLHWYNTTYRELTSPVAGLQDVVDVTGGETLTVTLSDGTAVAFDPKTGTTTPVDVVVSPVIDDVQPGGSYIITGTAFGTEAGTVTMNGFTFDIKSWAPDEVHIENPPTDMQGDLVLTTADGLASNSWYVLLEDDAPSDTPIEPQVCPVTTLDEHKAAVTQAGLIVLDAMPAPIIKTETVIKTEYVTQELSLSDQVSNVKQSGLIVLESMPEPVVKTVTKTETVEVARDLTMSELLALVEEKARENRANFKALKKAARIGKKSSTWHKPRAKKRNKKYKKCNNRNKRNR